RSHTYTCVPYTTLFRSRIGLLFGITWLMTLTEPIGWLTFDLPVLEGAITGQSLIILLGGLFLLYKSVTEIHHKLEENQVNEEELDRKSTRLNSSHVKIS